MSLHHTRHQVLVGVIVPLLIAEPLGAILAPEPAAYGSGRWRAGGLAVMVGLAALRLLLPIVRVDGPAAPVTALAHVPQALAAEPVLNDYNFGGYLIFNRIRPFVDGRADMYGDAFMHQYLSATLPEKTTLETALRDHGVRWTVFATGSPVLALLDAMPQWHRLYADEMAVVHAASR